LLVRRPELDVTHEHSRFGPVVESVNLAEDSDRQLPDRPYRYGANHLSQRVADEPSGQVQRIHAVISELGRWRPKADPLVLLERHRIADPVVCGVTFEPAFPDPVQSSWVTLGEQKLGLPLSVAGNSGQMICNVIQRRKVDGHLRGSANRLVHFRSQASTAHHQVSAQNYWFQVGREVVIRASSVAGQSGIARKPHLSCTLPSHHQRHSPNVAVEERSSRCAHGGLQHTQRHRMNPIKLRLMCLQWQGAGSSDVRAGAEPRST
jgi:hypothetical protein